MILYKLQEFSKKGQIYKKIVDFDTAEKTVIKRILVAVLEHKQGQNSTLCHSAPLLVEKCDNSEFFHKFKF